MRRYITLSLSICMIFSMVSCGRKEEADNRLQTSEISETSQDVTAAQMEQTESLYRIILKEIFCLSMS